MRSCIAAALWGAGCGGIESELSSDLGPADAEVLDQGSPALVAQAGENFVAAYTGRCIELGSEQKIAGAEYLWQIVEAPEGSRTRDRFNAGEELSGFPCECSCAARARQQTRTCFVPDSVGVYTLRLTVTRGDEQAEDTVSLFVPPVLIAQISWEPEADLNLHLRQQGAEWGSAGDVSSHNLMPDWGEPRGPSGEACDPAEFCACDEGRRLGLCAWWETGRCEEIADDPLYAINDRDGFSGGERIILARPPVGRFEIGVDNQSALARFVTLTVQWKEEVLVSRSFTISPATPEEPVAWVGALSVPQGEEGWWAGATFEEAAPP